MVTGRWGGGPPADPTPELRAAVVRIASDVELSEVVHSMIPALEGVPQRKRAPRGAIEKPALGEMPGFEGERGSYDESLSADAIPGRAAGMPSGAALAPADLGATGGEQEMPGVETAGAGMAAEDREMPGFDAP